MRIIILILFGIFLSGLASFCADSTGKLKGILYLTSPDTGEIVYIDLSTLEQINHIKTKGAPWEIDFDEKNNLIYISDFAKDQIYRLKPMENTISKSFTLPSMSSPRDIKVSEDGLLVYILENVANQFSVYRINDEKFFVQSKILPNPASFIQLNKEGLIAVTCPGSNRIIFLNQKDFSLQGHIEVGGRPEKMVSDPEGKFLYVTCRNENTVSKIDIKNKKVITKISVGEKPVSLIISQDGSRIYAGTGKSNTIDIIDTQNDLVTESILLPAETQFPGDMKITPSGNNLIVTSETTNTISIIDLIEKKIAVKLDVGATTHAAYIIGK